MTSRTSPAFFAGSLAALALLAACTPDDDSTSTEASGGTQNSTTGTGGAGSGGYATGGVGSGGKIMASGMGTGGGSGGIGSGGATTGGAATGGSSAEETLPPTWASMLLVFGRGAGCSGTDCHDGGEHNPLDLSEDDGLYGRLNSYVAKRCGDMPLVTAGDVENSAIIKIVRDGCLTTRMVDVDGVMVEQEFLMRMPDTCTDNGSGCLPSHVLDAMIGWVNNGALME